MVKSQLRKKESVYIQNATEPSIYEVVKVAGTGKEFKVLLTRVTIKEAKKFIEEHVELYPFTVYMIRKCLESTS